jgi:hypothetical protein
VRGRARRGNHLADEPMRKPRVHSDPTHARSSRGMLGLIGVIIVVVAVILMLLLFRGFGTGAKSGAGATGGKKIVPVEGLTANPGFVSAWVTPDGNVSEVLRVAGLENSNITDLGGGRYVISVPVGTEETVVRILAEIDGVYDAGRVYGEAP